VGNHRALVHELLKEGATILEDMRGQIVVRAAAEGRLSKEMEMPLIMCLLKHARLLFNTYGGIRRVGVRISG
jgi:hypothetical protein